MFQAYGLYTHIQANRVRSVLLLAGFVALLHALLYSILLIVNALQGGDLAYIMREAAHQFAGSWPMAMGAALVWFVIAFLFHRAMIRAATGARGVTREEAPELYNALENLCISRGLPMPRLEIMDQPGLNAYASGLSEADYAITVTRGLVDTLAPAELEAVLGHELTHIRNKDVQLMVYAVIFAGIFGFFGDLVTRNWNFPYGWSPTPSRGSGPWGTTEGSSSSGDGDRDRGSGRGNGGGGAIIAILIAVAIILISWGLSTLIRFALSRSREYLADAGAVELTKNPDAMISALRKIEANSHVEVPTRMEAFFIENPVRRSMTGFFDTHPSIDDRIAALQRFAGGRA